MYKTSNEYSKYKKLMEPVEKLLSVQHGEKYFVTECIACRSMLVKSEYAKMVVKKLDITFKCEQVSTISISSRAKPVHAK